jgi:hypothetical protein
MLTLFNSVIYLVLLVLRVISIFRRRLWSGPHSWSLPTGTITFSMNVSLKFMGRESQGTANIHGGERHADGGSGSGSGGRCICGNRVAGSGDMVVVTGGHEDLTD